MKLVNILCEWMWEKFQESCGPITSDQELENFQQLCLCALFH